MSATGQRAGTPPAHVESEGCWGCTFTKSYRTVLWDSCQDWCYRNSWRQRNSLGLYSEVAYTESDHLDFLFSVLTKTASDVRLLVSCFFGNKAGSHRMLIWMRMCLFSIVFSGLVAAGVCLLQTTHLVFLRQCVLGALQPCCAACRCHPFFELCVA